MMIDFGTIGISNKLKSILNQNGITKPTSIQVKAIPEIIKGKDVIAQAHTGTGKTLGFMLPMMESINASQPFIQGLIITPTRELAIQITDEAKKLAPYKDVNILAAYGGQDVEKQIKKLKKGIHIVIGTPGRLLDHIRRKSINFSKLKMLVLDEADQMLHMGFLKEVEEIINKTPKGRQTMLFSATMNNQVRSLASRYMKEPSEIQVKGSNVTLDEIKQLVVETTDRGKQDALCSIIDEYNPFMAIIFCRTKRRVSALNQALNRRGYDSDEIHGDLSQAKREKVMKAFRKAEIQLLVATDVAARGLDIEGITHVFNYDIAQDPESYIHRIGRTGRAGQTGVAVTFVAPKDRQELDMIERKIKMTLERRKIVKEKDHEKDKAINKFNEKEDKAHSKYRRSNNDRGNKSRSGKGNNTRKSSRSNKTDERSKDYKGRNLGDKKQNFTGGRSSKRTQNSKKNRYSKDRKF
ncbi:DEAD-box ATP-dependent RNA helicase CshA [Gottschalkia purinilytica]|uniref:DEAD-box ATP-dependent RNA helicase CshA n=1 Tax=Gottschalkia purinilytica TaxID=1503 RepID=A0A0L0WA83_GOTPU|nr:DEAD/DEAH box helicase [Gottschalkia purinilytica]KNF08337.1 DEAD-box ATP-dependent RNA helicase CshA [Gottschalkia purinilytica]